MKLIITLTTFLLGCLPYADFREYHYNQPPKPFHFNHAPPQPRLLQPPPQVQPQATGHYSVPAGALIQHFGLSGTAHVTRQLSPQYQTSGQSQLSYNQRGAAGGVAGGGFASSIASTYYPQSQQQQHHHQQQQQHTSNVNPLTQYQQQSANGNPPQAQQYTQNHANGQQQFGTNSHAGAGTSGQHGTSGAAGQNGQSQAVFQNGKYISQSESGQLHYYQHQQRLAGDTRPFSRQVANCAANGQCDHNNLSAGQFDHQHQSSASVARGKTEHVSEKCRRIAAEKEAALAANHLGNTYSDPTYNVGTNSDGSFTTNPHEVHSNSIESINLVRPKNRRLFEYTEVVLPNDPYN